jgi:serine/threonine protein kinase
MGTPDPSGGGQKSNATNEPPRPFPFGKYVLLDRVSVGGMAEVYRAKSFGVAGFEKIIAIKRILPAMVEESEFIDMFIDEAKIAGQLSHSNISSIYELGRVGNAHYIALEYIWGKDLLQIINRFRRMRKHMPPPMVAWIGAKICEGLDYAHRKLDARGNPLHIVHRDMSPQNVLVSYEGNVKIIDFGIAKAASRTTTTRAGVLKGKFGYMSPEQVRSSSIDARSDLFAVGTCMHEMATGERLFLGDSDIATLERVRHARALPPSHQVPGFPAALEAIIMRALKADLKDRWQSAREMQEALQHFFGDARSTL